MVIDGPALFVGGCTEAALAVHLAGSPAADDPIALRTHTVALKRAIAQVMS
ncbi:hypothetical protein D3C72_2546630 [compost metagenome]